MSQLASNLYFVGSNIGAPGQNSVSYQEPQSSNSFGILANQQHQDALSRPVQKKDDQQQSSNFNQDFLKQTPTTQPTASAPTGSNLVAGGPGTGLAASYSSGFGLQGAVGAGQLGTYGGTGLMSGTAAGTGAGWSGLGAASQGLTYGGSAAAGSGASGFGSLAGASQGLTYGGSAAAGSSAAAGGGAAAGGAGGAASGLASAGPWAALAAAIAVNESQAKKAGRRDEDDGQYAMDLISGKVLEQDADYYGDKVGGIGGKTMKWGGQMGNPEGVFNAVKKIFK